MERLMKSKLLAWLLLALPMLLLNARAADKITLEKLDSHEIHALNERANQSMQRFYAKERELSDKDYIKEKAAVVEIAQEQIELLKDGVTALRGAALQAESLSKSKSGGNSQYYSLIAQIELKRVELFEAMRERAELYLSDAPVDSIITKRNELAGRMEKLNVESR
jgi:hypothetical protein